MKTELDNFLEKMKEGENVSLELKEVTYQYFKGFLIKIENGKVFTCINGKWVYI